jgi:hypothetical protein
MQRAADKRRHSHVPTCSSTVLLQVYWNTTAASVTCLVAVTLYSVPSSVSSVGVLLLKTGPRAASSGTAYSVQNVAVGATRMEDHANDPQQSGINTAMYKREKVWDKRQQVCSRHGTR